MFSSRGTNECLQSLQRKSSILAVSLLALNVVSLKWRHADREVDRLESTSAFLTRFSVRLTHADENVRLNGNKIHPLSTDRVTATLLGTDCPQDGGHLSERPVGHLEQVDFIPIHHEGGLAKLTAKLDGEVTTTQMLRHNSSRVNGLTGANSIFRLH